MLEAITEGLDAKREMWGAVKDVVKDEAVFATNTSSLAVIDQAVVTDRPDRSLAFTSSTPRR